MSVDYRQLKDFDEADLADSDYNEQAANKGNRLGSVSLHVTKLFTQSDLTCRRLRPNHLLFPGRKTVLV